MDITTVFGTVVPGSNPGGSTNKMFTFSFCSHRKPPAWLSSGFESPEYVSLASETTRSGRRETFATAKVYLSEKLLVGFERKTVIEKNKFVPVRNGLSLKILL